VFHFDPQILVMSERSATLLAHMAEHLRFLSGTQSFWFTLDTSYDHGCHLARRLGLEPHDYEVLLIVAGLASYNRYGFKMKPTAWRTFLGGHHFMNYDIVIEFEPKKINLEAYVTGVRPSRTSMKTFYAIRIGTKIEGSPNKIEDQIGRDGRLVTTPPRLNLMRIKTQSFKEIAAQYLWQYAIDNEEEEVDKDEGSEEDEESSSEEEQQQVDAAKTTTTMVSPEQAPATKKRKLNDDVPLTVPDFKDEVGPLYPRLCRALGLDKNDEFDPTDPSIQKSMVALLSELNRIFSTEYELVVRGYGNKKIHYVRVPRASSDKSFRHSKEWLDAAIKISGSNEASTFNAAYRIANHLFRFYKDSVLAACETQKIAVCKPMTATGYAAMIKAANLTGVGEREVRKYHSAALGRGFCPSRRSIDILSDGHVEVKYNSK
jgi:hypothetical protein